MEHTDLRSLLLRQCVILNGNAGPACQFGKKRVPRAFVKYRFETSRVPLSVGRARQQGFTDEMFPQISHNSFPRLLTREGCLSATTTRERIVQERWVEDLQLLWWREQALLVSFGLSAPWTTHFEMSYPDHWQIVYYHVPFSPYQMSTYSPCVSEHLLKASSGQGTATAAENNGGGAPANVAGVATATMGKKPTRKQRDDDPTALK